MSKYHVNPETGNPGKCTAAEGGCPFGANVPHYGTIEEARLGFEQKMGSGLVTTQKLPAIEELIALETDVREQEAAFSVTADALKENVAILADELLTNLEMSGMLPQSVSFYEKEASLEESNTHYTYYFTYATVADKIEKKRFSKQTSKIAQSPVRSIVLVSREVGDPLGGRERRTAWPGSGPHASAGRVIFGPVEENSYMSKKLYKGVHAEYWSETKPEHLSHFIENFPRIVRELKEKKRKEINDKARETERLKESLASFDAAKDTLLNF